MIAAKKLLLPLLSGILLLLTLPFVGFELLIFFALVPLFLFLAYESTSRWQAFFCATLSGGMYGAGVLWPLSSLEAWWWVEPGNFLWEYRVTLLTIFLIALAFYASAISFGMFGLLFRETIKRNWFPKKNLIVTLVACTSLAILWSLLEWFREFGVLGFTWGHVGYAFVDTPLLPLARIVYIYGLSFIVIITNLMLFLALYERGMIVSRKPRKFFVFLFMFVLVGASLVGLVLSPIEGEVVLKVAVIHTGLTTAESTQISGYEKIMALLDEALLQNPDLVLFPENTIPFFIVDESTGFPRGYTSAPLIKDTYDAFSKRLQNTHATVAIGMHTDKGGMRYNSLALFKQGVIENVYHKRTLMPFAETGPEILRTKVIEPLGKGTRGKTFEIAGISATPLICSEIIYPSLSKGQNGQKSSLIINISNDAVFGSPLVNAQNHIMARVRAAEQEAYVLRSVKGGISSIIAPSGEIIAASSDPYKEEILFATLTIKK